MANRIVHCWTGRREWIEETYGYLSDEYIADMAAETPSATCLLPDGHDGPHEWTPDSTIVVKFTEEKGDG